MVIFPQCTECSYLDLSEKDNFKCPAFPDGIPDDVFWGKISHKKHIDGDHGYIFKQIEENE